MTPFIQPLDAGVIRCFKGLYRRAFSKRATDLDAGGRAEIYKINIREAMLMAKEAWDAVEPQTIQHCWNHTKIQAADAPSSHPVHADPRAWSIIRNFAADAAMTLPAAENQLQELLGESYVDEHWQAALKAITDAEGDAPQAAEAVEKLAAAATHRTGLTIKIPAKPSQLVAVEGELMASIKELKDRNRIFGIPLTIDEILSPKEENEVGEPMYRFEDEAAIVAAVRHQMAVERGEVIEVDSDDEEDGPLPQTSCSEIAQLCKKLEMACIARSRADTSLELVRHLRKFRGEVQREELQKAKQTTLDSHWKQ